MLSSDFSEISEKCFLKDTPDNSFFLKLQFHRNPINATFVTSYQVELKVPESQRM